MNQTDRTLLRAGVAIFLLAVGLALAAQAVASYQLPLWSASEQRWRYPVLGRTLAVTNNTLDVVAQPQQPRRIYNVSLVFDTVSGGYKYPVTALPATLEVFVAGIKATPVIDYTITEATYLITPVTVWPANAVVLLNYDPAS